MDILDRKYGSFSDLLIISTENFIYVIGLYEHCICVRSLVHTHRNVCFK